MGYHSQSLADEHVSPFVAACRPELDDSMEEVEWSESRCRLDTSTQPNLAREAVASEWWLHDTTMEDIQLEPEESPRALSPLAGTTQEVEGQPVERVRLQCEEDVRPQCEEVWRQAMWISRGIVTERSGSKWPELSTERESRAHRAFHMNYIWNMELEYGISASEFEYGTAAPEQAVVPRPGGSRKGFQALPMFWDILTTCISCPAPARKPSKVRVWKLEDNNAACSAASMV